VFFQINIYVLNLFSFNLKPLHISFLFLTLALPVPFGWQAVLMKLAIPGDWVVAFAGCIFLSFQEHRRFWKRKRTNRKARWAFLHSCSFHTGQNDVIGWKTLSERIGIFDENLNASSGWPWFAIRFVFVQKFNLAGLSVKLANLRNRQELKITLILKHDLRLISFLHEINAKWRISVDPFFFFKN